MSDPVAPRPAPVNPGPNPSSKLREEGELSSGADDEEALGTYSIGASNIIKSTEANQTSSATVPGKGGNSLSLAIDRLHKSVPPSYRNTLRMKQVHFKASTTRNLRWQKNVSSDNLVISFSDDDSGSDSGKSKKEVNRDRKGSAVGADAHKMLVTVPQMQTKTKRGEARQKLGQVTKGGFMSHATSSSTVGSSGANTKVPGTSLSRREPDVQRHITPIKTSASQTGGSAGGMHLSASKLESLRHEIALRESELRGQKRPVALTQERSTDLHCDQLRPQIEKLSFEAANSSGGATINTVLEPDGRSVKRLKSDQQCTNNQISGSLSEVPVTCNNSTREMNEQSTKRNSCLEDRTMVNCNASETEMYLVTAQPLSHSQHNKTTENIPSSKTKGALKETDKHAVAENTCKTAVALDTTTLTPANETVPAVTYSRMPSQQDNGTIVAAWCRDEAMPADTSMPSNQRSQLASSLENTDLLHCSGQIGAGQGSTALFSLFELEELEEQLEEAQEHRHRCEVEERKALRAYRKAQRALIEANERCTTLHRKRELFSARLHGFIADGYSSTWSSPCQNPRTTHDMLSNLNNQISAECQMLERPTDKPDNSFPGAVPHQPIDKQESKLYCSHELPASTADPKFASASNDASGPANHSYVPSDDVEENFPFPTVESRSECLENLVEENIHMDVDNNGLTSSESALDYEHLEAFLRSRLVERFSKIIPSKNTEVGIIKCGVGKAGENEHNKASVSLGPQLQEAAGNFMSNAGGAAAPEKEVANLAAQVGAQSDCSYVPSEDNHDAAIGHEDDMSSPKELCSPSFMSHSILPPPIPQNATRHIKWMLPGFCAEVSALKEDHLFSDATCEGAVSMPDEVQYQTKEYSSVVPGASLKDNDMLECGIDPFWPFCMFELRGKCNDEECPWQHVQSDAWRNSKQTKCSITSLSGQIPCGLFQHILPVPTYRIGSNLIKADLNLVQSVLSCSIWQYWQRGFCASFPSPLSVQRLLPSDAPFLQTGDGSIADCDRDRHLFYVGSQYGGMKKVVHGLPDSEQSLELALEFYCGKLNKPDRMEALSVLARAIETNPNSVVLWVVYLHIYYQKDEGLGKDDMFSHAVQHNVCSHELWLMYINSRLRFDDRLDAYNDALSMLCQMTANSDKELKDKSAFILDVFLQMIYFLCMCGNVEKAISRIYGLVPTATPDCTSDKLLTDVLSCLSMSDRCIFWVCCVYLSIYRKLPEAIIDQFELQKDLPFGIKWLATELRIANKGRAIELMKYAFDKVTSDIDESIHNGGPSILRLSHFLAVSHINCVAALEGLQCAADLLSKYMKMYPTCIEIQLISARSEGNSDTCQDLRGFDELLLNWPREVQGIQCFWNQYAEHALANKNIDLAGKLMNCWFQEYGQECRKGELHHPSEQLLPTSSEEYGSSRSEDHVYWFLNLSLYRMLQKNLAEAQVAVDEALRLASGKCYEHCLREHAALHLFSKTSSSMNVQGRTLLDLISGYLVDRRTLPIKELLSRRYYKTIKKHRIRQLMDDILGPSSPDSSLINSILEVIYGPSLLPEKVDEVKDFVDFVESVMEMLPANYQLALSACRFTVRHFTGSEVSSSSIRFWASSVLVNAIFRAVPVAPEAVWLEAADLLEKLQAMEIVKRFHQQATSVYPFSLKLWQAYLNASKSSGNSESIVEAARQRGLELNLTLP